MNGVDKLTIAVAVASAVAATGGGTLYLLTLPMTRRLPNESRVSLDGVTTVQDAVAACRRTGLHGWELVAYAQRLTARKFTYSRLNTWDSPARAFERGMGYCEQQALSLKQIYDALGIESRPVFGFRCIFPPKIVDGMPWAGGVTGHAWLRVRIGDDERDVCPGSVANTPGVTDFRALPPVWTLYAWLRSFTHLGSSIENIRRDRVARRSAAAQSERLMWESTVRTARRPGGRRRSSAGSAV
ncbi:MAG TPA: transglutaminase family protein [Ktedonobacterales bacterium]